MLAPDNTAGKPARSDPDSQLTEIIASNPSPVAPATYATLTATLAQGGLPAAAQAQAGQAPNAAPNAVIVAVVVVVGTVQAQQGPLANVVAPPAQAAQPPSNNTTPGQPHTVIPSTVHECTHRFPYVPLILTRPRSRRAAVERSERVSNRPSPQQSADLDAL